MVQISDRANLSSKKTLKAFFPPTGLNGLSNEKRGDYYGVAASWSTEKRLSLGFALLYRAFKIFLFEGERQLRPLDLKAARK